MLYSLSIRIVQTNSNGNGDGITAAMSCKHANMTHYSFFCLFEVNKKKEIGIVLYDELTTY